MELLRHGGISTGYAAQNLNLSRLKIFNLMGPEVEVTHQRHDRCFAACQREENSE